MMHSGIAGGHGGIATLAPVVFIILLAMLGYAAYYFIRKERGEKMKNKEVLILAAAALLLLLGFGGGMMGVGMGVGLLFWVVVIALVYYLIADKNTATNKESALDILDRRYASGEVSREEYLEMKKEIMET